MSIPRFANKDDRVLCSFCNERYAVFIDQLNPYYKEFNRCAEHMTESMKKRYSDRVKKEIKAREKTDVKSKK